MLIRQIIAACSEALFPLKCMACGIFLSRPEKGRSSGSSDDPAGKNACRLLRPDLFRVLLAPYLCAGCLEGFLPIESPLCSRCGIMFVSREGDDHLCGDCIMSPKHFRMARSVGVYQEALLAVLHSFKYRGRIRLAGPLSVMLSRALLRHWDTDSIDVAVPVPLHRRKLKQRGFNQAGLLLRAWRRGMVPVPGQVSSLETDQQLLTRVRWTRSQTGLGRWERRKNIKNAFRLNSDADIAGKRVLLIDDVYTTGATVNECARILKKGGAAYVDVLTLARAI